MQKEKRLKKLLVGNSSTVGLDKTFIQQEYNEASECDTDLDEKILN